MTRALVWIDSWQFECCGDTFAVGETVDWTVVRKADRSWLETVVGSEVAQTITHSQDEHGVNEGAEMSMTGRVLAISMASCSYRQSPSERNAIVPVPGTEVLRPVEVADGLGGYTKDLRWNGYVVDLEVEG